MPTITEEKLAELKGKHPGVEWIVHPALEDRALARPITEDEYAIYRRKSNEDDVGSTRFLIETSVVWPEKTDLKRLLGARPFAMPAIANAIIRISGGNVEAVREKA